MTTRSVTRGKGTCSETFDRVPTNPCTLSAELRTHVGSQAKKKKEVGAILVIARRLHTRRRPRYAIFLSEASLVALGHWIWGILDTSITPV